MGVLLEKGAHHGAPYTLTPYAAVHTEIDDANRGVRVGLVGGKILSAEERNGNAHRKDG